MTIEYDLPEPYQKIIKQAKEEIAVAAERIVPIMQELGRNVMVFQGRGFAIKLVEGTEGLRLSVGDLRDERDRLRKALEEMRKNAEILQQAGGATIYTKEQIKARLDGFVMTIVELATEALNT